MKKILLVLGLFFVFSNANANDNCENIKTKGFEGYKFFDKEIKKYNSTVTCKKGAKYLKITYDNEKDYKNNIVYSVKLGSNRKYYDEKYNDIVIGTYSKDTETQRVIKYLYFPSYYFKNKKFTKILQTTSSIISAYDYSEQGNEEGQRGEEKTYSINGNLESKTVFIEEKKALGYFERKTYYDTGELKEIYKVRDTIMGRGFVEKRKYFHKNGEILALYNKYHWGYEQRIKVEIFDEKGKTLEKFGNFLDMQTYYPNRKNRVFLYQKYSNNGEVIKDITEENNNFKYTEYKDKRPYLEITFKGKKDFKKEFLDVSFSDFNKDNIFLDNQNKIATCLKGIKFNEDNTTKELNEAQLEKYGCK